MRAIQGLAQRDTHDEHGNRTDANRDPLQGAQLFTKEHDAEGDVNERVDEVAEGGFKHLIRINRNDEHNPVDVDE